MVESITMTAIIVYAIIYVVQVFICYGLLFAYNQRKFPTLPERHYREDMGASLAFAMFVGFPPVIGVLMIFFVTGFGEYGFKIK